MAEKMDMLVHFTPSHKDLFNKLFKPSFDKYLKQEFNLIITEGKQECTTAKYYEKGWFKSVKQKIRHVKAFMEAKETGTFVFSDVDIEFFAPIKDQLIKELGDYNIAFQNDMSSGLCSGFYICKINPRTIMFFSKLLDEYNDKKGDQWNINNRITHSDLRFKALSKKFYNIRLSSNNTWSPGIDINWPDDIILMFHANWTEGIENKIELVTDYKKHIGQK
ncbi:MAG: glycosyltransferase family 77 protein [Candidatus Margulisbacteria bacterium]|nr:glycosyltransferase family 77 protein [Candidatus Margulisiibacteriota bacterium]